VREREKEIPFNLWADSKTKPEHFLGFFNSLNPKNLFKPDTAETVAIIDVTRLPLIELNPSHDVSSPRRSHLAEQQTTNGLYRLDRTRVAP